LPPELVEAEPELPLQRQAMVGYMASRTKFFDTFFLDATQCGDPSGGDPGGGPGFAVLAVAVAGRGDRLRARPARVLDFKISTLTEHGAQPACRSGRRRGGSASGLAEGVAGGWF
jgi:hypothetical protein